MKPKWGGISKYMGLDNSSLLPFKLQVQVHKKVPFCFQPQHTIELFPFFSTAVHKYSDMVVLLKF